MNKQEKIEYYIDNRLQLTISARGFVARYGFMAGKDFYTHHSGFLCKTKNEALNNLLDTMENMASVLENTHIPKVKKYFEENNIPKIDGIDCCGTGGNQ